MMTEANLAGMSKAEREARDILRQLDEQGYTPVIALPDVLRGLLADIDALRKEAKR